MPPILRASVPFEFWSQLNLTLLTGHRASDVAELLGHLRVVPGAVVYYHTHHFLVQHQYLSPEPPNDFSYWVAEVLGEERLGEQLASVDILRFSTIRELRQALIAVIEGFLENASNLRTAPPGEEFYFKQSVSFVLPTPIAARDLREFRNALEKVSSSSIAYHMFDARLRLERGDNDFSHWLECVLGERQLAEALRRIDPYSHTDEGLRRRMVTLVDARLVELERAGS